MQFGVELSLPASSHYKGVFIYSKHTFLPFSLTYCSGETPVDSQSWTPAGILLFERTKRELKTWDLILYT